MLFPSLARFNGEIRVAMLPDGSRRFAVRGDFPLPEDEFERIPEIGQEWRIYRKGQITLQALKALFPGFDDRLDTFDASLADVLIPPVPLDSLDMPPSNDDDEDNGATAEDGPQPGDDDSGQRTRREKIEDYGEVIPGARKLGQGSLAALQDRLLHSPDTIGKEHVWPLPSWEELHEAGYSTVAAAFIRGVRASLAPAPAKRLRNTPAEQAQSYIAQISLIRDAVLRTAMEFTEAVAETRGGAVGFGNDPNSMANWTRDHLRRNLESAITDHPLAIRDSDSSLYSALQEHMNFKKVYALYQGQVHKLITRAIPKEAFNRRYEKMRDSDDPKADEFTWDMLVGVERAKRGPREAKIPTPVHGAGIVREGFSEAEDYTQGRDITPEEFCEYFGFRGIQFGNWMTQEDRQLALNAGYNSLSTLASIVGIEPKAVSLGGTLAAAFGARGKGKAAAHYEPGQRVYNLTRASGAGALAHEWFHAFDHWLGDKYGAGSMPGFGSKSAISRYKARGCRIYTNGHPNIRHLAFTLFIQSRGNEHVLNRSQASLENSKARGLAAFMHENGPAMSEKAAARLLDYLASKAQGLDNEEDGKRFRTGVQDYLKLRLQEIKESGREFDDQGWLNHLTSCAIEYAFAAETLRDWNERLSNGGNLPGYDTLYQTDYYSASMKLDKGTARYYAKPWEMGARAFETYIHTKLTERGCTDTYLVSIADTHQAYPQGRERMTINEAMDAMCKGFALELNKAVKHLQEPSDEQADNGPRMAAA